MFDISPIQIIIVLVIALLVFGPKKLPELARSVGRGVREFRGAISLSPDDAPAPADRASRVSEGSHPTTAVVQDHGDEQAGTARAGEAGDDGHGERTEDDDAAIDGIVVSGEMPPPARPSDEA